MHRRAGSPLIPSPATFAQTFAFLNADRYFELFQLARLPMPLFSIVGGLAVFAWSRRLYGTLGGLLSLTLWVFCPNILAHARLVTSDLGSTALGVAATYVFWRYLASAELAVGGRRGGHARPRPVDQVHHALALCRLAVPLARAAGARDSESGVAVAHCPRLSATALLIVRPEHRRRSTRAISSRAWGFRWASSSSDRRSLTRPVTPGMKRPAQQERAARSDLAIPRQSAARNLVGEDSVSVARALRPGLRRTKDRDRGNTAAILQGDQQSRRGGARSHDRAGTGSPGIADRRERGYPVYLNGELQTNRLVVLLSAHLDLQGAGRDLAPGHSLAGLAEVCRPLERRVGRGDHPLDRARRHLLFDELS